MTEIRITPVRSETTDTTGRSINNARDNHYVIDEPDWAGGPGEAITPEESFLSGISACGVSLVESVAEENGYDLKNATATIRGIRNKNEPSEYTRIEMDFVLTGVAEEKADELVEAYKNR